MLSFVSVLIGCFALLLAIPAFIPFLGWANWLIVPIALFGALIGQFAYTNGARNFCFIVAGSLGYFLNPLVNVLLGTLLLKESLRRGQAIAVGVAAVGVAILAVGEFQTLWISLGLALTFAFYGLVRKLTPVPSAVGLAIETVLLAAPAIAAIAWFHAEGALMFGKGPWLTLGLIGTGAVTSIPLILFAVAARSLPLVTLGLMQYVAPSLQFLTGVFLFGEKLSPERWASFLLIWAALALFIWDSLRGARLARRAQA
ncbi:MAG: EamA family transporter RarD [Sphingomonadales bacterium]|nr:EamA family transporter RarD [Sphingomonadales bacterium]